MHVHMIALAFAVEFGCTLGLLSSLFFLYFHIYAACFFLKSEDTLRALTVVPVFAKGLA